MRREKNGRQYFNVTEACCSTRWKFGSIEHPQAALFTRKSWSHVDPASLPSREMHSNNGDIDLSEKSCSSGESKQRF